MNIIEQWANSKFICESFQENPDDYKSDKLDIRGNDYEKELKDKENHEKNLANKAIKENEMERCGEKNKKTTDEAMSVDDIINKYKDKWASGAKSPDNGQDSSAPITEIDINEMYDGYVNATVRRGAKSEEVEMEIPAEDIQKMLNKLRNKQHNGDKEPTDDDACAALVYLSVQKNIKAADAINWVFGKAKKGLSDWEFYDKLDMSMMEDPDKRTVKSVWNTGKSNSDYNELDMDTHDDDTDF